MRSRPVTASWSCWIRTSTARSPWTFPRGSRSRTSPPAFPRLAVRRCTGETSTCGPIRPYNPADPHNPMLDSKGRVWMTSKIRSDKDPSWCSEATNKFAEWFPLQSSGRQAAFFDRSDAGVHAHRHVLFDASPAVRQRSRRDGVLQRAARSDLRLDRHEGLRPDEGRAESGGLVRAGARHQRRRQDHEAVECPGRSREFGAVPGRHDRRRRGRTRTWSAAASRSEARHDGQLRDVLGHSESG